MHNNKLKKQAIEEKMLDILNILEMKVEDGNESTARRVANMYVDDLFKNINNNNITKLEEKMTIFPNPNPANYLQQELIIVKDIPFFSTCEHHLLPFFGKISVGYLPKSNVIGLSKIPRVVKYFSKQPQIQERFVRDIGDFLYYYSGLNPELVIIRATDVMHTCVTARGIETQCSTNTLSIIGGTDEIRDRCKKDFLAEVR